MARPDSHIDRLNSNRGPRSNVYSLLAGIKSHGRFREAFHRVPCPGRRRMHHRSSRVRRSPIQRRTPHEPGPSTAGSHWPGRAKKRFDVVVLGLVAFVVVESFEGRAISFVKDEQRPVREHLIDQMIQQVDQTRASSSSIDVAATRRGRGRASAGAAPSDRFLAFEVVVDRRFGDPNCSAISRSDVSRSPVW